MSNEPNEAERAAAIDIYGVLIENDAFAGATSTEVTPSQIAHIIAAHRADESELAKALEEIEQTLTYKNTGYHPIAEHSLQWCAERARAALAAHAAAKS